MIGIGYTTYRRPRHIAHAEAMVRQFTDSPYRLFIHDDTEKKLGIAKGKNECLRNLRDCDYVFLFDDDTFPYQRGWEQFYIEAHKASGQHHFVYLKETSILRIYSEHQHGDYIIQRFTESGGTMMFLTKEVIEKVGGYCQDYKRYGFEHAGYSQRICKVGLNTDGEYLHVKGAGSYIYAMDYDFHLPYNKELNHAPSMAGEWPDIISSIKFNREVYEKEKSIILQSL